MLMDLYTGSFVLYDRSIDIYIYMIDLRLYTYL